MLFLLDAVCVDGGNLCSKLSFSALEKELNVEWISSSMLFIGLCRTDMLVQKCVEELHLAVV